VDSISGTGWNQPVHARGLQAGGSPSPGDPGGRRLAIFAGRAAAFEPVIGQGRDPISEIRFGDGCVARLVRRVGAAGLRFRWRGFACSSAAGVLAGWLQADNASAARLDVIK
jgi:hypothetical protein